MTAAEFFGCAFVGFGPALALFVITIAPDPVRIIILIASMFFWLLSLLLSSILWSCMNFSGHLIVGVIVSVILQEVFRYILYRLLRSAEGGLMKIALDQSNGLPLAANRHILAYVSGLGFGLMSGAFALINVLADILGPGTVGLKGGSVNFVMISAALTHTFILLNTFWSVIFFAALDIKNYWHLSWVIGSHFIASGLTFFNIKGWYVASLLPCYVILILSGVLAYRVVGGTWHSLTKVVNIRN